MTSVFTEYACGICNQRYATHGEAAACEARGLDEGQPAMANVGDVVFCGGHRFGWFDGDPAWVLIDGEVNSHVILGCMARFFYVVTHVDVGHDDWNRHNRRYHLFTNAMTDGYSRGFTSRTHHHIEVAPANIVPSAVLNAVPQMIGLQTRYLL